MNLTANSVASKDLLKALGLSLIFSLFAISLISFTARESSRKFVLTSSPPGIRSDLFRHYKGFPDANQKAGKLSSLYFSWMGRNKSKGNNSEGSFEIPGLSFDDEEDEKGPRDFDDNRDMSAVDNILNAISDPSAPSLLSGSGVKYGPNLTVFAPEKQEWIPTAFPYSVRRRAYRRNDIESAWANFNWTRHGPHTEEMWIALKNAALCVKRGLRTQAQYDEYKRELLRFTDSLIEEERKPKKIRKSKVILEWCQWAATMVPCVPGYGGAWYPAGGRTADYGVWAKWQRPLPQFKCPIPLKGARQDLGDGNSVYAGDREQGYLFSAS